MSEDELTDAGLEEDLDANADESAGVKGGASITQGSPGSQTATLKGGTGSGSGASPIAKLS